MHNWSLARKRNKILYRATRGGKVSRRRLWAARVFLRQIRPPRPERDPTSR